MVPKVFTRGKKARRETHCSFEHDHCSFKQRWFLLVLSLFEHLAFLHKSLLCNALFHTQLPLKLAIKMEIREKKQRQQIHKHQQCKQDTKHVFYYNLRYLSQIKWFKKLPFSRSESRADGSFKLAHMDLWGFIFLNNSLTITLSTHILKLLCHMRNSNRKESIWAHDWRIHYWSYSCLEELDTWLGIKSSRRRQICVLDHK